VISIDGLQTFVDRLSRLDVGRAEADALERAARDLEASVNAIASIQSGEASTKQTGRKTGASVALSCRISDHSVVIGAADSAAITREVGCAANLPDPILSRVARQSGQAIAERIGQTFVQLVSEIQND
jgi:hypothetical protein